MALNLANAVNFGAGTQLTLGGSNDLTLGGVVAGNGGLIKNGAGLLTLNNTNTFDSAMRSRWAGVVLTVAGQQCADAVGRGRRQWQPGQ